MYRQLLVGMLALPAVLAAQSGRLAANAPRPVDDSGRGVGVTMTVASRADEAPTLDGRGDDAVWAQAMVIDGFRGFEPKEDADPRFRTELRVAYDERNFYALVRAFDAHPDSIRAYLSRRDENSNSDWIYLAIDSYHDRRTAFAFMVNPAGVKRDIYIFDDGDEDSSWDAVWDVATRIDEHGWTAEFRIPLSQLRYSRAETHTFGIGVLREIARYNESVTWPRLAKNKAGIVSQLAEVSGLKGLGSARRLEVTPYSVAKNISQAQAEGGYGRAQLVTVGADVKYGLTSNLTVDATVNPDFGQVEADPSELNLSAFETFFEERRPFFLEGSGMFQFNTGCGDGGCSNLFYSRRIGRSPQLAGAIYGEDGDASIPTSTTMLGAAKLSGRLGSGLSIGVLDAVTQREVARGPGIGELTAEPRTNYFLTRLQQDFRKGGSGVGMMFTAVHRDLDEYTAPRLHDEALTLGIDARHRFAANRYEIKGLWAGSRVTGDPRAIARTQRRSAHYFQRPDDGVALDTTRTALSGDVRRLQVSKIGGGVTRFNLSYQNSSPGLETNDMGFLSRTGMQSVSGWMGLNFNTPRAFYRKAFLNFNAFSQWNTAQLLTGMGGNFNGHVEFRNSWWGHMGTGVNPGRNRYCDRCTRGGPALRESPSAFGFIGIESDERKAVALDYFTFFARADEGRSRSMGIDPGVRVRFSDRLTVRVSPGYNVNRSAAQWYTNETDAAGNEHYVFAHLFQRTMSLTTRINVTATPTLSLQLYAQPFVTAGDYSDPREASNPRAERFDDRFTPYARSLSDFNYKQFRSNAVVRWEYRPGSTLFVVWQQGREQSDRDQGTFDFRRDYGNLFEARPDNTLLVKASYWFSL